MSELLFTIGPANFPALAGERRAADRHTCNRICYVKPNGRNAGAAWGVLLHDISRIGVSLVLRCELQPATVMAIQQSRDSHSFVLFARVVRAEPHPQGWLHGCEFLRPLNEVMLERWLPAPLPEKKPQDQQHQ
jgi:hypothetical protein